MKDFYLSSDGFRLTWNYAQERCHETNYEFWNYVSLHLKKKNN